MNNRQLAPAIQSIMRPVVKSLLLVVFFSFFINVLTMTLPLYMMQTYDRVIPTKHTETLVFLTLIALFAVLVYIGLETVRSRLLTGIGEWTASNIRNDVLWATMKSTSKGRDISNRPLQELDGIKSFLSSATFVALFDLPWLPLFIIIIWSINYVLGIAALLSICVMVGISALTNFTIRSHLQTIRGLDAKSDSFAQAAIQNTTSILAMRTWPQIFDSWSEKQNNKGNIKDILDGRIVFYSALTKGMRMIVQILILGLGAYLVVHDEITMGTIIAVSIMLGKALAPIDVLIGGWKQFGHTRNAVIYLNELLRMEPLPEDDGIKLPAPRGNILVQGMSAILPGSKQVLVSQINFNVPAGKAMAIIGPSGAGKSSLCKALLGYIPIVAGSVRLDGAEIADWRVEDLAPHIGYLPQKSEFMPGTIKENIARFHNAKDREIVEAAQLSGIHEIILSLPQGYNTELKPDGSPLSGGQQQRIGLARALFGKPRIIILDEPNSNMDAEGAFALNRAIKMAKSWGSTIIMVVHTSDMFEHADLVLAMNNGKADSFGPTQEVLARYSNMKKAV